MPEQPKPNLAVRREALRITRQELAERAGVHPQTITRLEAGLQVRDYVRARVRLAIEREERAVLEKAEAIRHAGVR